MVWEGVCPGVFGAGTDRIRRFLTVENHKWKRELDFETIYLSASRIDYPS